MAPLTPSTGAFGFAFGIATAAILSGGAITAVLQSGCDDPGAYHFRSGIVELAGSCVQPDDFPVPAERPDTSPRPLGSADATLAP
ncbi:hypothetical protein [Parasphingorhabdus pacifica]